jgi:NADPH:quinone reductase-like Zn-dependent oxidoreductase
MKAVRMHGHGGVENLRYEEVPDPGLLSPEAAVVKLKAASLNHIDLWTRRGETGVALSLPHILGADGAGVVVETGPRVKNVRVGDAVCLYPPSGCGDCEFCLTDREFMCIRIRCLGERLEGTYAQYVTLPAANCFAVPPHMSFEEAAAFPLVFVTAWRMLVTNARLRPGETLLVIGVGGGVASAALLLAKQIGAHVIVTSGSHEKLEMARRWGADHGIHHFEKDVVAEAAALTGGRGVDVVLDCVAGDFWQRSLAALAKGGRLVTCGATAGGEPRTDLKPILAKNLKIYGSTLGSREEFRQLLSFMTICRVRPILDQIFPLEEAAAAQQRLEAGRQFGKIVLEIPQ